MRKIFLDVGGNNGCSVKKFRNHYDKEALFEIFSFEPNEKFHNFYDDFKNHYLHKSAAWIYDGQIDFFVSPRHDSAGSSLYEDKIDPIEKTSIIKDHKTKVNCIDLSKWIKGNFREDDHIILKMDVEGAEYKIVEKMVKDESISMINKIFIEWHYGRIPSISLQQHKDTLMSIPQSVEIFPWDALLTQKT